MNKNQILFVSDLDGTLLTHNETVSPFSARLLNEMIDGGMLFTYATTRSYSSAKKAMATVKINAPVILYNGGLVYREATREVLRCSLFRGDEKAYILSVLREHGVNPIVFGASGDREMISWHEGCESFAMRRYLDRRLSDPRLHPVSNDEALLAEAVFYFGCFGARTQIERAWNNLKLDSRFICIYHKDPYSEDYFMEISPREATKANAVAFLRWKLGADKVVCFGDSSNDSDMFDVCDEKYAVMNADGWLKEKATGVIGYCEEDGVAKFLRERFR